MFTVFAEVLLHTVQDDLSTASRLGGRFGSVVVLNVLHGSSRSARLILGRTLGLLGSNVVLNTRAASAIVVGGGDLL